MTDYDALRRLEREATRDWSADYERWRAYELGIENVDDMDALLATGWRTDDGVYRDGDGHWHWRAEDIRLVVAMRNALPDLLRLVAGSGDADRVTNDVCKLVRKADEGGTFEAAKTGHDAIRARIQAHAAAAVEKVVTQEQAKEAVAAVSAGLADEVIQLRAKLSESEAARDKMHHAAIEAQADARRAEAARAKLEEERDRSRQELMDLFGAIPAHIDMHGGVSVKDHMLASFTAHIAERDALADEVRALKEALGKIGNDSITFDEQNGTYDAASSKAWRASQRIARDALRGAGEEAGT